MLNFKRTYLAAFYVNLFCLLKEEFDPSRSIKKPLGDTSFYCPVTLKEKGVLWPGDPECGAKYREKVYYLSDADARDRFLADPVLYLPTDRPFVVSLAFVLCSYVVLMNLYSTLIR